MSASASQPAPGRRDLASLVQGAAALLWLPQAASLAWAIQALADGAGVHGILPHAAAIVALGALRAAAEAWGIRRVYTGARQRLSALRAQAARALVSRSPLDAARPASGRAASVIAEQAEALVPYLVRYQPARWKATLVPLAILPAVAWFSWVAALVLLLAAPLIPVFMALVGWRAKAASEAQMVELGGMHAFLLDRLRGLKTLRAFDAVELTAYRLEASAQSLRVRTMAVLRIAFLSSAVLELFAAIGVALVAAYIGFHLLGNLRFGTWGQTLTLAQGMFVLLLAPAFFEPLRELSAVWHDRAAGEAALEALNELSQAGVALPGADHAVSVAPRSITSSAAPAVRIRGLRFAHPGQAACIDGLDLDIAAGEHVALMGASGTGKSTLLALIAGLLAAQQGSITIGGTVLTDASARGLRDRMGWMGQTSHVFAGSVRANVALGREAADAAHVDAAMRFAALDRVAQAHPSMALGEGGTGLSGGEAVRLALARVAVVPGADLLLVDEPTAHLDTETAARVADALVALARGKTLIAATHDPVLAARLQRAIRLQAHVAQEAA